MTGTTAHGPWGPPPQRPVEPAGSVPAAHNNPDQITVDFVGKRGALFWLALKTGFFSILTLGFYRFWMKTRLRRWYWSAIRPGGHPMEYVGDPIEKLLGFFIAVVILTFYIGIVNLLLMFVSFSVFSSSSLGYLASFAGVVPLWFYARYRARRYVLGRTRWRGVRFGLEKGAWGYAIRALWYWALTIVSLGILWPRMTFLLEKYRTDRTYFGSARLFQGGRWTMLYRAAVPFICAVLASLACVLWFISTAAPLRDEMDLTFQGWLGLLETEGAGSDIWAAVQNPAIFALFPFCLFGLIYGAIHYRWVAKRIMAQHKRADGVHFASALSGVRVSFIYVFGNALSYLTLVVGITILVFLAATFFGWTAVAIYFGGADLGIMTDLPRLVGLILLGMVYLLVFLMWGVMHNVFVTFPLMRHMAQTTTLSQATGLAQVSQRARDSFAEAEGFAEALDLGAAI